MGPFHIPYMSMHHDRHHSTYSQQKHVPHH